MYLKVLGVVVLCCTLAGYLAYKKFDDEVRQAPLPKGADLIVCMAFSDDRADRAVALLKEGYGRKIVATTKQAHDALQKRGLGSEQLLRLDPEAQSTYQEGLLLRRYLQNSGPTRIVVVSDGVHLFRVHWTFTHLLHKGGHRFWFVASGQDETPVFSWKTVGKVKSFAYELAAVLYYWFVYGLCGIEDSLLP